MAAVGQAAANQVSWTDEEAAANSNAASRAAPPNRGSPLRAIDPSQVLKNWQIFTGTKATIDLFDQIVLSLGASHPRFHSFLAWCAVHIRQDEAWQFLTNHRALTPQLRQARPGTPYEIPLWIATCHCNPRAVCHLAKAAGANINYLFDQKKRGIFHCVAADSNANATDDDFVATVKALIDAGADHLRTDEDGCTPARLVAAAGNPGRLQLFADLIANIQQ